MLARGDGTVSSPQKDTYQHKSRLCWLRQGPQLLLQVPVITLLWDHLPALHTVPNQLLCTHRTHRRPLPDSSPDTPLVGVRRDHHFLTPIPGLQEAGKILQRLGAVQHDASESSESHSLPSSPAPMRRRCKITRPSQPTVQPLQESIPATCGVFYAPSRAQV